MLVRFTPYLRLLLTISPIVVLLSFGGAIVHAQTAPVRPRTTPVRPRTAPVRPRTAPVRPQEAAPVRPQAAPRFYTPIPLGSGNEVVGQLSNKDIPTGQGGFAKDYEVTLTEGDQVAIDLISEDFDTIVSLLAEDGSTVAENDDGPDGSTNSLLFTRIVDAGTYVVRVRAFGETNGGNYTLKVTRLRPI